MGLTGERYEKRFASHERESEAEANDVKCFTHALECVCGAPARLSVGRVCVSRHNSASSEKFSYLDLSLSL